MMNKQSFNNINSLVAYSDESDISMTCSENDDTTINLNIIKTNDNVEVVPISCKTSSSSSSSTNSNSSSSSSSSDSEYEINSTTAIPSNKVYGNVNVTDDEITENTLRDGQTDKCLQVL